MNTFASSPIFGTTVCVCDPRQVCTVVTSLGFLTSEISNTRMPRTRSLLTGSGTPSNPQSARLLFASDDMNSRLRYTDTSFCDAGQRYDCISTGFVGLEMSKISKPL